MRTLFAPILGILFLIALPASAEWVKISESNESIWYLDPSTIKKNGNFVRMWGITELKKKDKDDGHLSRRALYDFDCKNERYRILTISAHSERMAGGKVLSTESIPTWDYIAPETVGAFMFELVCLKNK